MFYIEHCSWKSRVFITLRGDRHGFSPPHYQPVLEFFNITPEELATIKHDQVVTRSCFSDRILEDWHNFLMAHG